MKNMLFIIVMISFLFSCKKQEEIPQRQYAKFWKKDIIVDSTLSIRAFEVIDGNVYYASGDGKNGIILEDGSRVHGLVYSDTMDYAFRSSAFNERNLFFMSIESPALIYKLDYHKNNEVYLSHNLVYQENHSKAFYDAMDFWNDDEGIAIGDPTDDCMSIIITRDGGETWTKLSCEDLPKAKKGEAAFAASDTNIAIIGDHTWVATGGKASRVLYSSDKGKTWEVYETPITQGKETTGIYSLDFYDDKNGFAIGGDYTKPNDTLNNKIRTSDGGKTWQVVANGKGPGYRSCVQYVPNSNAIELVAVGFKGIDYSNDAGSTWSHLSDEGFYTIRFLNDSVAYAAGKGRISKLTFRE
ncbi:WD40/YVTN/BNR-like repeat-containing protein [Winogradskyella thalassocola]|uniref:BNR/Asp-box repeat-containing protein n=1 Tax=Winogradskyella thalassocola TaxID=262004 RepID=A0A1G8AZ37_9FLAO|nr:oxidoreductase [Winogradskyella thalassocola]SDH26181.1 BNR/Asp-box repeat-containing protein [Winogradskyella thalassocola]